MKNLYKFLTFILAVLLSQTALAQVIGPGLNSSLNTWDLYVFGDGNVVGDILENISLFINPTSGNSGFRALIATLAVTGLFVSVLQAMLNPAQGFIRVMMLIGTYLIVSLTTFSMRLNINVIDSINTGNARIVQDVPFSVGIMPVVISKVGYYLTESLETFLQVPGDNSRAFSLTRGTSRGHFNLFGKLVTDLDRLRINEPNLKKSYSQYIADCSIPAMALGKMSLAEIQASKNLITTLKKAATPALLTRYFSYNGGAATGGLSGPSASGASLESTTPLDRIVTCQDAMNLLEADLTTYGNGLKDASAAQLDNTGIRVDQEIAYNALFKSLITGDKSAGGTSGSVSTSTLMLQKAMVSSTSDAFRKAAAQTGNNELLQAARLSEAELNQRSAWVLGAETFKNMMGYVYIVLQCFIFAMVPLILIALMIPGLGKSILVNYVQIMLWMALWLPGLAVVNYLITLFGRGDMSQTANNGGAGPGINIYNHMALSEAGNNLIVAAQFLGTMVPTITWGLVKGAMAFQEFISAGVGSSFASSAANGLASGSLSYGNLSANTGKMNDFNTATSISTGQTPPTFNRGVGNEKEVYGPGGELATSPQGLHLNKEQGIGADRAVTNTKSEGVGTQNSSTAGTTGGHSAGVIRSAGDSNSHVTGTEEARTLSKNDGVNHTTGISDEGKHSEGVGKGEQLNRQVAASSQNGIEASVGTNASASPGKSPSGGPGGKAAGLAGGANSLIDSNGNGKVGANMSAGAIEAITNTGSESRQTSLDYGKNKSYTDGQSRTSSLGSGESFGEKASNQRTRTDGTNGSSGMSGSTSIGFTTGASSSASETRAASDAISFKDSTIFVPGSDVSMHDLRLNQRTEDKVAFFNEKFNGTSTAVEARTQNVNSTIESARQAATAIYQQSQAAYEQLHKDAQGPASIGVSKGGLQGAFNADAQNFNKAYGERVSSVDSGFNGLKTINTEKLGNFFQTVDSSGVTKPDAFNGNRDENGNLIAEGLSANNKEMYLLAGGATVLSAMGMMQSAGQLGSLFARGASTAAAASTTAAAGSAAAAAATTGGLGATMLSAGATAVRFAGPVGLVIGGGYLAYEILDKTGTLDDMSNMFKKGLNSTSTEK